MQKKFSSDELLNFVKSYVESRPYQGKIVAVQLAEYVNREFELVEPVAYHHFCRDKVVKAYIDDYNGKVARAYIRENGELVTITHHTIDVDALLKGINNKQLRKRLVQLNEDMERINEQNQALLVDNHRKDEELYRIRHECSELRRQLQEHCEGEKDSIRENKELRKMNKYLRSFIVSNIEDAAVLSHLVEIGFLQKNENTRLSVGFTIPESTNGNGGFLEEIERFYDKVSIPIAKETEPEEVKSNILPFAKEISNFDNL